jgi:hypothetical protein
VEADPQLAFGSDRGCWLIRQPAAAAPMATMITAQMMTAVRGIRVRRPV